MTPENEIVLTPAAERVSRELSRWFDHSDFASRAKEPPAAESGLIDMKITVNGPTSHDLRLSYVTDAPSWKPSYRLGLGKDEVFRRIGRVLNP